MCEVGGAKSVWILCGVNTVVVGGGVWCVRLEAVVYMKRGEEERERERWAGCFVRVCVLLLLSLCRVDDGSTYTFPQYFFGICLFGSLFGSFV